MTIAPYRICEKPKALLIRTARAQMLTFNRLIMLIALSGLILISPSVIFTSCSKDNPSQDQETLTNDESYLIDTYIKIIKAENLYQSDSTKAEDLFAAIDSTLDSLRIANTISSLNKKPDRWVNIFRILNEKLKEKPEN